MSKKKRNVKKPICWFIIRIIFVVILNITIGIGLFVENPILQEKDVEYYTGTVMSDYSESTKLPQSTQTRWFMVMDDGTVFRTHHSMLKKHPKNFVGKTVTIGYLSTPDTSDSIKIITFSEGGVEYISFARSKWDGILVNITLLFVSVLCGFVYIMCRYSRIKEDVRILKERREIERKRQIRQKKREEAQKASSGVQNHLPQK